jgi:tryptophan synthase alpha chain
MSLRLDRTYAALRASKRAALLPYIMLGYPDPETSLAAARAALDAGADGLELGLPFSDPLADGPTIQAAGDASLRAGMTVERGIEMAEMLRREYPDAILFLMSYLNPLLAYGVDRLLERAAAIELDGFIVPDLPVEEEGNLGFGGESAPPMIHLLAPNSSEARISLVASKSRGMLYLVSVTGTTGARNQLSGELEPFVRRVRERTDLPLAVGFGISSPYLAAQVAELADGAIIGSALVRTLSSAGTEGVGLFVAAVRAALDRAASAPSR